MTDIGLQVELLPVEQEVAYTAWRKGAADPTLKGDECRATSPTSPPTRSTPSSASTAAGRSPRSGVNWSHYTNAGGGSRCATRSTSTFDPAEQDRLMARRSTRIVVDDAVQVWVVHDTNPHALSGKVHSYVQAQHWFQDLTTLG